MISRRKFLAASAAAGLSLAIPVPAIAAPKKRRPKYTLYTQPHYDLIEVRKGEHAIILPSVKTVNDIIMYGGTLDGGGGGLCVRSVCVVANCAKDTRIGRIFGPLPLQSV